MKLKLLLDIFYKNKYYCSFKEEVLIAEVANFLSILRMLSSEKKTTAKQISKNLEMNIRTAYR